MIRCVPFVTVVALLALGGCPQPVTAAAGEQAPTTLYVSLAGTPIARVEERRSGAVVERVSHLTAASDDVSRLSVTLDDRGFVTRAVYSRRGPRGDRDVTLVHARGETTLTTANGSYSVARGLPVVLLETLHHLALAAPVDVVFVDVTAGDALLGSVRSERGGILALDEHGAVLARASRNSIERDGPGLFVERESASRSTSRPTLLPPIGDFPGPSRRLRLLGLDGMAPEALALDATGQRREAGLVVELDRAHVDTAAPDDGDERPSPFLESDDDGVRAFAKRHAGGGVPAADALALAGAIHELLDTSGGGGPPSAVRTLATRAGDCDDATALLVAALRSLGHPARPVVGYRHHEGKLVPHAWAEVYDGRSWLPVDALVPGLGPFDTHLRLFEGLGSALTMGRVLGAIRVEALGAETNAPPAR